MSGARRLLWVDASQGASGDMLLGALVDLGVEPAELRAALEALPVGGWSLEARKIVRCGLAATKVDVTVDEPSAHRGWHELEPIATHASLAPRVRERARAVFRRLIEAEAEVHGRSPEEVHLHEAGAVDAIVDVIGTCVGLERLGIEQIVVSAMTTGFGQIECAHGVYPVPAPATAALVRGLPVRGGSVEAERLTPTGAAILTTLADRWGSLPEMTLTATGNGAGSRDLGAVPNMLRLMLGQTDRDSVELPGGEVAVLECTVDDATPQALAFACARWIEDGALDAFTAPVTMKKGRQGHHLTVLARPEELERLARRMLTETSSLGLRYRLERRFELERSVRRVETEFGPVDIKVGMLEGRRVQVAPEYDDCATLAERHGVPLTRIQRAALRAFESDRTGVTPEDG